MHLLDRAVPRSGFLTGTAAVIAAAQTPAVAQTGAVPARIIDTHAHFYDPSRPQGVPWPDKTDTLLYRTVLPEDYRRVFVPLGITGMLEIEASPWLEDNQWVLDLAAKDPIIVGTVGDLDVGGTDFRRDLERFRRNQRFRGIRLGSPWRNTFMTNLETPQFLADLRALADADLELDLIDGNGPALLANVLKLNDRIPDLRVVVHHLPYAVPSDPAARATYQQTLREIGQRPRIFAKVANVLPRTGPIPDDVAAYRPTLDDLWAAFGPDRLLYASNWPPSSRLAPPATAMRILREYVGSKGQDATDKFFWRNAVAAYKLRLNG